MFNFERLKYINHLGRVIDFGVNGFFVNANDMRDYQWEVVERGSKIAGFRRGMMNKSLPIVVFSKDEEDAVSKKNRLYEEVEKDVIANQAGKVVIGGYYFKCFVVGSSKANYVKDKRFAKFNLELVSDEPYWVTEQTKAFRKSGTSHGDNLDYPYDYPYDYFATEETQRISNDYFAPAEFRMTIYGTAVNPTIDVGGHVYKVNTTVADGEILTIDSMAKSVVLTQSDGTKINRFDLRDRTNYIFEPIPSGSFTVSWVGNFNFDITLLEKRSEPKWT